VYEKMHNMSSIKLANGILNLDIIQNVQKVLDTLERERERERECACVWCACVCVVCACVCTRVCRGCNNSKEYPSWCNFVCTISNEYSVIIVFHILPVENPTQKKYGLMVWYQVTMVATVYIYCIQSSSSIWKMMCY